MKIGVMSDLHLGYRQYGLEERENDFYNHFLKSCLKLNDLHCDMVIIAGDIFDKPNPTPKAINVYLEGIKNLTADIIIAIKGNHTMLMKKNHYSVDELIDDDEINGYYLLDDEVVTTNIHALSSFSDMEYSKWNKMPKVSIDGITFRPDTKLDEFIEVQKELADESFDGIRILVTHQAYQEFCGFSNVKLSIRDIDYEPYDLIINGHIHSWEKNKIGDTIFLQPGSIERMNTAEALDESERGKGVWVIDIEKDKIDSLEFVRIECPRKFFQGEVEFRSENDIKEWFSSFDNLEGLPILSYNYHDFIGKPYLIRDGISSLSSKVLTDKSNIYDETLEEICLEIEDGEIPTVLEALNMIDTGLSKDEKALAIDIHNAINNDNLEIKKLLEDFRKKHFDTKKDDELDAIQMSYKEIEEFEKYFESL